MTSLKASSQRASRQNTGRWISSLSLRGNKPAGAMPDACAAKRVRGKSRAAYAGLLLSVLLLASCSGKSAAPEQPGLQSTQAPVITVLNKGNELPDVQNDVIKKALDAKLGIDLQIIDCLGNECANQLNVGIAEGDPPDLFYVTRQDFKRLAKQGALLNLAPYADLLESPVAYTGSTLGSASLNGDMYGIQKKDFAFQYTYWVRQDWLDKLGLSPPRNLNELMTVAKAITEQDPDGNGKNDTYGFGGNPTQALGPIFGAFGTTYPGHFYIRDGKLVNSLYDPSLEQAIVYLKSLFDAGVVDPDFLSNTKNEHEAKAFQGQVGLFYYNWPNMIADNKVKEWKAITPNARWEQVGAPQGPGGAYAGYYDPGDSSILVMPRSMGDDPYKLNKIIHLLNYLATPEGSNLVMYGVQGKNYSVQGGRIVPTGTDVNYAYLYQLIGRKESDYLQTKFPKQEPYFTFAMKQPLMTVYDSYIDPPADFDPEESGRYIEEQMFKFIYGRRPLAEYGAFLHTLETDYHYADYMQAASEQLKSLRLIR